MPLLAMFLISSDCGIALRLRCIVSQLAALAMSRPVGWASVIWFAW